MIGRDFRFGTVGSVKAIFGDNLGHPYVGPLKIKFLDAHLLAVIDKFHGLHIQTSNGKILYSVAPAQYKINKLSHKEMTSVELPDKTDNVISYLDIAVKDVCAIPMTKNIAVCDMMDDNIKVLNREEWYKDREMGIVLDDENNVSPTFEKLNDIETIVIGQKQGNKIPTILFCTSEQQSDRICIWTEYGKQLLSYGQLGIMPGQFNSISAISCYRPKEFDWCSFDTTMNPSWFHGHKKRKEVEEILSSKLEHYPGT